MSMLAARSKSSMTNQTMSTVRYLFNLCFTFLNSDLFTGNQLRDQFLRWLLPSGPPTNHNIARKAHPNGTAQWFIKGKVFNHWKSTGTLLWIRGKRVLLLTFTIRQPLTMPCFFSRFREKCPLVRPSSTHSALAELTPPIQFLCHRRYHSPARYWECLDGLLLF